jgi:hypothetical protein
MIRNRQMPIPPPVLQGALRIESAIIEALRKLGVIISPENILWNSGRRLFPTPALVTMEITRRSLPAVNYIFM